MANPVGRPPKLTPEQRQELLRRFEKYIQDTDDPTIAYFVSYDEMAIKYWVTKSQITNDWTEFSNLVKRAIAKQESYLIKQEKTPTMAIFRLKQPQHGYKDRIEQSVDITGGVLVTHTVDPKLAASFTEYLKANTMSDVIDTTNL